MTVAAGFAAALLVAGIGYLALAGYVWSHRQIAASRPLLVLLLAVTIWTVCYAVELTMTDVGAAKPWSGFKFVGIVMLPPSLWAFVWQYTGRGNLPHRVMALMMIHPVVVLGMLVYPGTHDLIHFYPSDPEQLRFILGTSPYPENGALFWAHSGYTSIAILGAVFTLLVHLARIAPAYRRQGAVLIVAALIPFFGNMAWTGFLGRTIGTVDPTPFLFGITVIVLVWGFLRLRLLNLVPVARSIVIEQMGDGLMVLDRYGRVVDANPAAVGLLGHDRSSMVGHLGVQYLPELAELMARTRPGEASEETEVVIPNASADVPDRQVPDRIVAVTARPVTDQTGHETARLVMMHDITERRRTEAQLRELLDEQTRLADTLQQGLRPSTLPDLTGVRLAARSIPATRGGVSGDFYDVHPAGPGRSAFVLGDVSGKGVHAAVVTSMARYTVRTLSAQGWRPSQVLEQLNQALLGADDPERFCTVVYGHLEPDPPGMAEPGGVRVTLALGGHPPPLLRRRDRRVMAVGRPGTALGLMSSIEVHEVELDLAPGDVLLAYTDGVTEARGDGEQFGEHRLARVLAEAGGGGAPDEATQPAGRAGPGQIPKARAGTRLRGESEVEVLADGAASGVDSACPLMTADEVADAVLDAVRAFASSRDDVALLVLAVT